MKRILKYKYFIYSFVLAFIVLLFTSKNSFLYVFNDWVDANAFFTVGKSMFNNVVPYKDIFEQKGLLLYLIYGIGYLFSNRSFHGVFILEVVSFGFFLYYVHHIFSLFFNKKYSFVLLSFIAVVLTTSSTFVHGGSCEEFCLPFIAVSLYYFIRHFNKELSTKEIIINGLMAGLVLMMKYTLLSFWIGFGFVIFVDYLFKKEYKEFILFCFYFLIGMFIPFFIVLIYLLINGAVKDFFDVYFVINMSSYVDHDFGFFERIIRVIIHLFELLYGVLISHKIVIPIFLLVIIYVVFGKYDDKKLKISLIGLLLFMVFFTFWGLRVYIYYFLPILFLGLVIFILYSVSLVQKYIDIIIDSKFMILIFCVIISLTPFVSYLFANYKDYIGRTRDDYFQYKYADYINRFDSPTLLNTGYIDLGVYTVSGVIPNTRFFELLNIPYEKFPDNEDSLERYIRNKEVKFIVYTVRSADIVGPDYYYDNYTMVYKDTYIYEGITYSAALFELKDGGIYEKVN